MYKRVFSKNLYKLLKIPLAEMSFGKDFVSDKRGDLYPILSIDEGSFESVSGNTYKLSGGLVRRWIARFFPYASYSITADVSEGEAGFSFFYGGKYVDIILTADRIWLKSDKGEQCIEYHSFGKSNLIVSCRPGHFDLYGLCENKPFLIGTMECSDFDDSDLYSFFNSVSVALYVRGHVTVYEVSSYIDSGISTADIRPIRYENGDVIFENGKIFLTASIRLEEKMMQGIFSWIPSTSDIDLTGVMFYDVGDGRWSADVAASLIYDRNASKYRLWVCSFSHGHRLAHAEFDGDVRYGVNVVDVKLMDMAPETAEETEFLGFTSDEDPDFFYDSKTNKWYMAICRVDRTTHGYRYAFFESDRPFDGYKFIGRGLPGCETGGSFVKLGDERVFICGNDFKKKSDYRIYSKSGMTNAEFDYPDGGFRGWGTVIPVKMGTRTRRFWITFDRHNGSSYNWSYGNIYCFEQE